MLHEACCGQGPAVAETASGSTRQCRKRPVLLCTTFTAWLGEGRDNRCAAQDSAA